MNERADPPASDSPAAPELAPLGPDDFDAQEVELDLLREDDEEIPQWEFCEGFLAALVCARRAIAPKEYWPVLLGDGFKPVAHMSLSPRTEAARKAPEPGRNDPCPCGSGKKYKKCHGAG